MPFRRIFGHENPISALKSAVAGGRLAHAYLFSGMEAIGKRTTALAFAQLINCEHPEDLDACGACSSCRKIDGGLHPDISVIAAQGAFIRIGDIRQMQERMSFRPLEGRKRVLILDDADRMNDVAANALLKTLEEPPPFNILILVTTAPHRLPVTVVSRCRTLRFRPLSPEAVAAFLRDSAGMEATMASFLASVSGGSIGRALRMDGDAFLESRRFVLEEVLAETRGRLLRIFGLVGTFGGTNEEIGLKIDILRTFWRDVLVFKETGEEKRLVFRDQIDRIRTFAGALPGERILEGIRAAEDATAALERNANKQLTLETMLIKVAQL